jgi:hypothetical protein
MKIEINEEEVDRIVCTSLFNLIQDIENDINELVFTEDKKGLIKALKRVKLYYCGYNDQNVIKNKSCKKSK